MTTHWIRTADGSMTRRHRSHHEGYHSLKGAWSECHHVFLRPFLQRGGHALTRWRVLDVGFGLGLNWLCFANAAIRRRCALEIVSLECDPALLAIDYPLESLRYGDELVEPTAAAAIATLKRELQIETARLSARLLLGDAPQTLADYLARQSPVPFDVILQDAFSPPTSPTLWQPPFLSLLHQALRPGGLLLTYSAAGQVRRDLQALDFLVEKEPGFGKREQIVATKGVTP